MRQNTKLHYIQSIMNGIAIKEKKKNSELEALRKEADTDKKKKKKKYDSILNLVVIRTVLFLLNDGTK